MSVAIQDLSDDDVVHIAGLLSRRPEYGIAMPSRRWLLRQQEKMQSLPKILLKPKNPLKLLAMKIAGAFESDIVDPQAVLCKTHSLLNPFLIRRLFIALAYEVTVHSDHIRSWAGRTTAPELSAYVGRLDSIAALWTEPGLFSQIYGLPPFEGRHVFVRSGCEACCLAAVGASGRALADLRAGLVDRMERRRGSPERRAKRPRLFRVVEAWITHLDKGRDKSSRADECLALSQRLLAELTAARPMVIAWRNEQKKRHARLRASKQPVYSELRASSDGHVVVPLPAKYGHKRRTKHGIPVAMADAEGAENQRRAAALNTDDDNNSIYRPDSLAVFSVVGQRHGASHNRPSSSGREQVRRSMASDASPTASFLRRFEHEMPLDLGEEADPYDALDEGQDLDDERDPDAEERSRQKVQDWWASQFAASQRGRSLGPEDTRSMLSMVHPAFRPAESVIAESILPAPLRFTKNADKQRDNDDDAGGVGRTRTPSIWTDCTVHTAASRRDQPEAAPPVPELPSKYQNLNRFGNETPTPPPGSSTPPPGRKRRISTSHGGRFKDPFRDPVDPFKDPVDPFDDSSVSPLTPTRQNLNWPAPPRARRPAAPHSPPDTPTRSDSQSQKRVKPDPNRYDLVDSDAGSIHPPRRRQSVPPERNPFTAGSRRGSRMPTNPPPRRQPTAPPPVSLSRYASSSVYSVASGNPYTSSSQESRKEKGKDKKSDVRPHDSASCSKWVPKKEKDKEGDGRGGGGGKSSGRRGGVSDDAGSSITQFKDFM
ncbi:hypothetical protein F5Y17DRAFT_70986 [Xylariaceae sp. FL0594]|nr:hypothetical protein F5Y17DRAFT_70986 [Xylariaceae sp. FL0594]